MYHVIVDKIAIVRHLSALALRENVVAKVIVSAAEYSCNTVCVAWMFRSIVLLQVR